MRLGLLVEALEQVFGGLRSRLVIAKSNADSPARDVEAVEILKGLLSARVRLVSVGGQSF